MTVTTVKSQNFGNSLEKRLLNFSDILVPGDDEERWELDFY